jgi:hypothetical protein
MKSGGRDEPRQRRLIYDYFGEAARIRALRPAPIFGAPVFVVDFDRGQRHYRTLGSFGGPFGSVSDGIEQVTEQSSMDLLYPANLVFHYERLMSLGLALADRPATALLLGIGGAAMWRFVRAYLPECTQTLVDYDETVVEIARRWFYLDLPVVLDTAQHYLAAATERFDAVLVDLYDSGGPAAIDAGFWANCLDVLAPGGCLAVNWADFATNRRVKTLAEMLSGMARDRGIDGFYATRRGFRDNLIQYLPTGSQRGPEALAGALERFARERRLPERGRGILEGCVVTTGFPLDLW